jgi:hypothetical protein
LAAGGATIRRSRHVRGDCVRAPLGTLLQFRRRSPCALFYLKPCGVREVRRQCAGAHAAAHGHRRMVLTQTPVCATRRRWFEWSCETFVVRLSQQVGVVEGGPIRVVPAGREPPRQRQGVPALPDGAAPSPCLRPGVREKPGRPGPLRPLLRKCSIAIRRSIACGQTPGPSSCPSWSSTWRSASSSASPNAIESMNARLRRAVRAAATSGRGRRTQVGDAGDRRSATERGVGPVMIIGVLTSRVGAGHELPCRSVFGELGPTRLDEDHPSSRSRQAVESSVTVAHDWIRSPG